MSRSPYRTRRADQVVPLEVAERVAAERDAALRQFDRVRRQLEAQQRRLAAREEENLQLRRAVAALQQRRADVDPRRAEAAEQALRDRVAQLEEALGRFHRRLEAAVAERDQLAVERDAITAERDAARAALGRTELQLGRCEEGADGSRVEQLTADLANVRRHVEEEITAGIRAEAGRLIERIAGIRDALERARQMLPSEDSPWAAGLASTLAAIDGTLDAEGVDRLGAPGERFDPRVHEAVAVGEHPDGLTDVVLQVHQVGLAWRDGRLIRPATVTVSG